MNHLKRVDYFIETCPLIDIQTLVANHHYARGGSNTATYRHGLYHKERGLVGGAWWIPPTKSCAQSVHEDWKAVLSLTRLVVLPGEPTNAASFLLGASIRMIKKDGRYKHLVTYADERMGHTGQIYKATNWTYAGARPGDPVYLDSGGRQVSRKSGPKTRRDSEMLELGYVNIGRSKKHKFVMHLA